MNGKGGPILLKRFIKKLHLLHPKTQKLNVTQTLGVIL